ncbi:MAG: topoisomerase [Myxococcales bacterium]|nr:topoisomerase [Myxococcales bacterium]
MKATTTKKKIPTKAKIDKADAPDIAVKARKPAKSAKPAKAEEVDDTDEADTDEAEADEKPTKSGRSGKGRGETALVIVESPAKAKTIKKYLGAGFTVKASVGHVMDLPKSKMGVDIEHGFTPEYVIIRGKNKIIAEIKKSAKSVDIVYLAPDPDREGEAIAFHLAQEIKSSNSNIKRILFNEITKRGITEALQRPGDINLHKFESQQARRILDRLVGYEISPILWKKVRRGLSAGRVQSVAVRIIVEREREIGAFKPVEYWTIEADVEGHEPPPFRVRLVKIDGQKAELGNGEDSKKVVDELRVAKFIVDKVDRKERKKNPLAPFITSRLQQEAARKLRFTAKKTMALAQRLYEGLELGAEGAVGLITYMRTDSTRLSDDAVTEARAYIAERYGKEYLPDDPVIYKTKKSAQDAHEAIRPTSMTYDPETVKRLLTEAAAGNQEKLHDVEDHVRLYQLIWNRFIACQMKPAIFDQTVVDITAGRYGMRANGQVLKFPGYSAVYHDSAEETGDTEDENDRTLPAVNEGETLKLHKLDPEQHFTQPPPRFSEASLVKELEEKGIGRPSTYANILSTIQDRGYVEKKEGRFHPTTLGTKVNDLLVESFPDILDVTFTASMEDGLDAVEEGSRDWVKLLGDFYSPFKIDLEKAVLHMRDLKREETPTDFKCGKCNSPMVIKWGRNGEFLACSGYPECKSTKEFLRKEDGTIEIAPEATTNEKCETCAAPMLVKRGRFGEFLACSRYPDCKTTRPISLGVTCPRPGCGGFLTEKRSRRGKVFFGCSNYAKTQCDFVSWDRPVPQPCPQCNAPFLVKRENRRGGGRVRCIADGCGYNEAPAEGGESGGSEGESTGDAA